MNFWVGDGRLTKDPELKTGASGKEYCKFTIACDRKKDKDGNKPVDWIDCTAFGQTAALVSRFFHKGDGINVMGRFESEKYTDKNGQNRTAWGVTVDQVLFPLGKKSDSSGTAPSEATQTEVELPF